MGPQSRDLLAPLTRRPVQCGVSVRRRARDRARLCARQRDAHLVRGRAGLGAVHPDRVCRPHRRRDRRSSGAMEWHSPGSMPSICCVWRKPIATGGTTSATRTRRWTPASVSPCALDKAVPFIGRDALLARRQQTPTKRLVQFRCVIPSPCCFTTSRSSWTARGLASSPRPMAHARRRDRHGLGAPSGRGHARPPGLGTLRDRDAGARYPAEASLSAFYDPKGERMRSCTGTLRRRWAVPHRRRRRYRDNIVSSVSRGTMPLLWSLPRL